ncbi:hypothetical protein LXA43DRAFT_1070088, partial [Ganoderma leucocontextum]
MRTGQIISSECRCSVRLVGEVDRGGPTALRTKDMLSRRRVKAKAKKLAGKIASGFGNVVHPSVDREDPRFNFAPKTPILTVRLAFGLGYGSAPGDGALIYGISKALRRKLVHRGPTVAGDEADEAALPWLPVYAVRYLGPETTSYLALGIALDTTPITQQFVSSTRRGPDVLTMIRLSELTDFGWLLRQSRNFGVVNSPENLVATKRPLPRRRSSRANGEEDIRVLDFLK